MSEERGDPGGKGKSNYQNGTYQADPLNRLNSVDRSFDGATYRTAYQYDKAGLLTGIQYPEAVNWLQYNYNNLNQLAEVQGFTGSQGITYDNDGAVKGISYVNGVNTAYSYDDNRRLQDIEAAVSGTQVLKEYFTYDKANNIKEINDGKNIKTYTYDANNQLTDSVTQGRFLETDPTPGTYGLKTADNLGGLNLDLLADPSGLVKLDYNSSSIGIDFGTVQPGVKKSFYYPIRLSPGNRITDRNIVLLSSVSNSNYQLIPRTNWEYVKDSKGIITFTLKERLAARFLKIHVKFDERGADFKAKDKATFLNELAKMIRIYQEATSRTEHFDYDAAGNRKLQQITLVQSSKFNSLYYHTAEGVETDRLKTNGKYAFKYDAAGNVTEKGNKFTLSGVNKDTVTYTKTGEGIEYWTYQYDLLNRLIKVTKNGTIVSEYAYDPEGLRVVKRAKGETTHYIFEGTEPVFEKRISDSRVRSYVYALGKHLARADGVIGDAGAKKYFYHTDQVGSVKAVTDDAGKVVWNGDYRSGANR